MSNGRRLRQSEVLHPPVLHRVRRLLKSSPAAIPGQAAITEMPDRKVDKLRSDLQGLLVGVWVGVTNQEVHRLLDLLNRQAVGLAIPGRARRYKASIHQSGTARVTVLATAALPTKPA